MLILVGCKNIFFCRSVMLIDLDFIPCWSGEEGGDGGDGRADPELRPPAVAVFVFIRSPSATAFMPTELRFIFLLRRFSSSTPLRPLLARRLSDPSTHTRTHERAAATTTAMLEGIASASLFILVRLLVMGPFYRHGW
jgi:hypothetical protein